MNARHQVGAQAAAVQAQGRKVLFTAVRNEAPFLLEWIAYHQVIGFDLIVVASNDCDDGTAELADALAAAGQIIHIEHKVPVKARPQGNAARLVNEMGLVTDGDWALWLDADEFLNIHVGNGLVDDLLDAIEPADGAMINWRIFGDSGNARFPGRFVSEAFTGAAALDFSGNGEVKTLFRKGPGIIGFAEKGIHRPRLVPVGSGEDLRFLAPSGQPIDGTDPGHRLWFSGIEKARHCTVPDAEKGYALAQINHYTVRTRDMFDLKRRRGRGWARRPADDANARHTERFFASQNRNEAEDRSILRFEAAVTDRMATLVSNSGVAQALELAQARTDAMLAEFGNGSSARAAPSAPPTATAGVETETPDQDFELTLPEAAAHALREAYASAEVVLEYGSGGSSFAALELGARKLFTVESDAEWATRIERSLRSRFRDRDLVVHSVDIGTTKEWGKPDGCEGFAGYPLYPNSVWDLDAFECPDVVLIDGRFRVACFLTVMLRCTRPVRVLFDDYKKRREYHWIEEFFTPTGWADRMALFDVTPTQLPARHLTRIASAFVDAR